MAKNYKQFNLLEVAYISGVRVSEYEGTKRYVATADINLTQIVSGTEVTYKNRPSRANLIMKEDEVLFAKMKSTKKVLSGSQEVEDLIFSTGFYILKPKENISKKYLYFFLLSDYFNTQKDSFCSGATMAAIGNAGLKKIQISIPVDSKGDPDFSEQEYIASLLEEAEKLQKKRAEADQKMEEIIPALFNKMFGDLNTNPMNWPMVLIGSIIEKERGIKCGPFGSTLKRKEYVSSGIPVWGIPNMKPNEFIERGSLFVTKEKFAQLTSYNVKAGDLLISRAGTVGIVCVANPSVEESIIGTNLIRVALDKNVVVPEFLSTLINEFKTKSGAMKVDANEGSYSFVSTKGIQKIQIYLPPISKQNEFAQKVNEIQKLKTRQKESAVKIDSLFTSLLSKSLS